VKNVRALLLLLVFASWARAESLPLIPLKIGEFEFCAEVAATQGARERGLMHRKTLAENQGMLFVFPESGKYSLWMANTIIPLNAAFLDAEGVILAIVTMHPQESAIHSSPEHTAYALEMNAGWFDERRIRAGDKVKGVPPR
jgi:uncharacterized protein